MNIGVIVDNELINDKRVLRETELLTDAGYSVSVLCFAYNNRVYREPQGISVKRIRIRITLRNILFFLLGTIPVYEWLWARKIEQFIMHSRISVLHVHDLYMSKAAAIAVRRTGKRIPLILDLHENFAYAVTTYNWTRGFLRRSLSNPSGWSKREGEYLSYADRIVVLSEAYRNKLVSEYSFLRPENFFILPNVPDLPQVKAPSGEETKLPFLKKNLILFYFGIVAERRGIFNALNSFRNLVSSGILLDFLIIGPVDKSDSKRFKEIIADPGLKDNIIYIPWISLGELPAYLGVSDICIAPFIRSPQHDSGVANKIYDYMSGSRPVVASDCIPQKELIEKYRCGLVYSDDEELKNAITMLMNDENLRHELGRNGYNAIINDLNIKKAGKALTALYSELTNLP
jgi:glycosyltransferase involved in cell wall biosynthesis